MIVPYSMEEKINEVFSGVDRRLAAKLVTVVEERCFVKMTELITLTAGEWVHEDIDICEFIWKCANEGILSSFSYYDPNTGRSKAMFYSARTKVKVEGYKFDEDIK